MTGQPREKTAAACETCGAICVAWILSDGSVVPVSTTVDCGCEEVTLRTLERFEPTSDE